MARKKKGGKWIKKAIKRPGAFKKKASKAGMSTSAYSTKVLKKGSKASTRTKRQAALAKTLGKCVRKRGIKSNVLGSFCKGIGFYSWC